MQHKEIRRPLGIIRDAAGQIGDLTDRELADRFQRSLAPARRIDRGASRSAASCGQKDVQKPLVATPSGVGGNREDPDGSSTHGGEAGGKAASSSTRPKASRPQQPKDRPCALVLMPCDAEPASMPILPVLLEEVAPAGNLGRSCPDGGMLADANSAPEHWEAGLVRMVVLMCGKADPAFVNWSVTVPMDPSVLPETELRMTLSPHHLSLRFHTDSSYSLGVMSLHRQALLNMLALAVQPARHIDIELT